MLLKDDELKAWAKEGKDWGGELWWVAIKVENGQGVERELS